MMGAIENIVPKKTSPPLDFPYGNIADVSMGMLASINGELPMPDIQIREEQAEICGRAQPHKAINDQSDPTRLVTLDEAQHAFRCLVDAALPANQIAKIKLSDIEQSDMAGLSLASTLLTINTLNDLASAKAQALAIITMAQQKISDQRVIDYQQRIDNTVAQTDKARKAGIVSVVFDWIIAVVEILSGLGKALVANVAGGALDFAAGITGLVHALSTTLALLDPSNRARYHAVAAEAGKIQLALEITGSLVDIVNIGRGIIATRTISKTAEQCIEGASGIALTEAIHQGTMESVQNLASRVGQQVADATASHVTQALEKLIRPLAKEGGCATLNTVVQRLGFERLLQNFTVSAIQEIVTQSVVSIGKTAINHGSLLTVSQLAHHIAKDVNRTVLKRIIQSSITLSTIVKQLLPAIQQTGTGIQHLQQAEFEKIIQSLLSDQQWLNWCFEYYETVKIQTYASLRDLVTQQEQMLEVGSHTLVERGNILCRVAASSI